MESVICDLCGDNHTKKLWTTSDRWTKTGQRFDIVRCLECGLVFVNPRPDKNEIERFYPEEYSPYHRSKKIRWFLKKNFQLAREVNILRKFLPEKAKILEIGAGGGEDLAFLRDRGKWLTEGTDLSPYAKETAQKEFRLNLTLGQLEEISFPNESFDLVRNKYVLEHVHSPKSMIGETYRILKPGGTLIVFVPGHLYLWGENDMLAHHVRRYKNRAHLSRVLQKNGFHVERCSWWNIFLFLPIATIILLIKLKDRIFHRGKHEPGDHIYELPRLLNRFLKRVLVLENKILAKGFDSPVGVSLFAVARKKP